MHPGKSQTEHINEFHKLVGDLAARDNAISDKDQVLLLLTSLPSYYDNFVETLLYGRDTMKLEDVVATLNSRELQKMTEAKGDGCEGFYMRGRSGQRDVVRGQSHREEAVDSGFRLWSYRYVPELRRNLISLGSLKKGGFYRKDVVGQDQGYEGFTGGISGTRRATCVYTLDGQATTRNTLKGRKQLGEYQTRWKIKTGNVLDSCNQRSTQQYMKSGVAKHLGVAGIQQQNRLVNDTNMTLFAKVRCFLIQSGLSKVFWAEDTTISTYLVNRSPSSATGFKTPIDMLGLFWNMGFNESGEYKKTFIGSDVGTGSMQVLQGVEFEVESQDDNTFEVEPHGNVDHVVGSQEEDSNEAAFAVAIVEKIYAYESLNFNNIVACEVISKWKAGFKDDMYAQSDAEILATKGLLDKAKGNALGMEIIRDQSGNTLRVSQSRIYNGNLVQTLLEGHSILSLEGSLSGDCDVEKNGKWSCIYAVGSQEYQMVCMRLDIASADVGMLDKFDRGLQTDVQAAKEAIWLKGLVIESGFELKIVAGIATGALSMAIPGLRFQH
ncbi:zinc finger, CCHC-type containing protein [Tanacetum coccineum]